MEGGGRLKLLDHWVFYCGGWDQYNRMEPKLFQYSGQGRGWGGFQLVQWDGGKKRR